MGRINKYQSLTKERVIRKSFTLGVLLCCCGLFQAPAAHAQAVWVKPVLQVVIPAIGRKLFNNGGTVHGQAHKIDIGKQNLDMIEQRVQLVINNGFASVEVFSTFANPNSTTLEARYRLPLPQQAVLSEFSIIRGEEDIEHGEVVARDRARRIYQQEKNAGHNVGLAEKHSYKYFEFRVTEVPANGTITLRHRYYQPLKLDHGVGRFVFPREAGQTDEQAQQAFWQGNVEQAQSSFSFDCTIRSAYPLQDVRLPAQQGLIKTEQPEDGVWRASFKEAQTDGKDVVVYYRLADNLPGRVEIIPYKPDADKPGYFMMLLTPGLDLKQELTGTDYTFVLDVSGSMSSKLGVLAHGVQRALGRLRAADRFRLITFNDSAREHTPWTAATPENVERVCRRVARMSSSGSTNLYEGMQLGVQHLHADRPSAVILVTDGVTNQGVTSPRAFYELSQKYDVRLFSFLMGNSANWPLMDVISKGSGGFYTAVSNQDDIIGQVLLAKERMTRECLHAARLQIKGLRIFDTTDGALQKIYHGQQLCIFGRYAEGGAAEIILDAKMSGSDKRYRTIAMLPEQTDDYPEIERLWAMHRVEDLKRQTMIGKTSADEAQTAERDLGVAYQIVTDETSMLVLSDDAFKRHGIDRTNKQRIEREQQARVRRQQQPVTSHRVDQQQPMFDRSAGRVSSGGGSTGPLAALLISASLLLLWWRRRHTAAVE